jgi:hypothetical protein
VRATRANWYRVTNLAGPPGLNRIWAPAGRGDPCGSFASSGDNRAVQVANIHSITEGRNISASFDLRTKNCLSCKTTHNIADAVKAESMYLRHRSVLPPPLCGWAREKLYHYSQNRGRPPGRNSSYLGHGSPRQGPEAIAHSPQRLGDSDRCQPRILLEWGWKPTC